MNDLIRDRETFLWHLIDIDWKPQIWNDETANEVCIEWLSRDDKIHAIVGLDGTGFYGYAYLVGEKFVAGKEIDPPVSVFPKDLRKYLKLRNSND